MRLLILLLALVCAGFAATPAPADLDALRRQVADILKKNHTPGAAIAIVRRDGPEWVAGVGLANVAARIPATADTLFRIGSTSKAFVSLSLLKLQREGRLSLNDTLESRAPDLAFANPWKATDPVRIVNLLEHTTGWDDMSMSEYRYAAPDSMGLREALAFHPATRTSRWRPGTRFAYSNEGPPVGAYIVEQVTGRRFEDYVTENFFRPIGMSTATYFEPKAGAATLYLNDGRTPVSYWHILLRPAGAINASARDMAAYVAFYLNRGRVRGVPLLPAEDIIRMETPTSTLAARGGLATGYGLSNYTTIADGWVWHGHNGGVIGGLTELDYQPEAGVGFAVMINSGNGPALNQIVRAIRHHLVFALMKPALPPADAAALAPLHNYDGWYQAASPRSSLMAGFERLMLTARLKSDGKGMRVTSLRSGGRRHFVPVSGRLLRREDEPAATLALLGPTPDGFLIQFAMEGTYERVPGALVAGEAAMLLILPPLMLSVVIFAVVWIIRTAIGEMKDVRHYSVRVLPLLASLALAGILTVCIVGAQAAFERFGQLTVWSALLFLFTTAFPLLAFGGVVQAVRWRRDGVNRVAWWYSFATSVLLSIAAIYFGLHGWWAVRIWA
ncbi:MAG TPA: serine hydrolase domain-containing protein [Opitutus sp.]|nr:serine hydrolase domain-containing protein [Opitutus sp.]